MTLHGVNFAFNSAALNPSAYPKLNQVVTVMKEHPNIKVRIEGYTDDIGTASYNLVLSKRRAESAMNYLISAGVPADRLSAVGYGMKDPVASNKTSAGRAANRRVEFVVVH